MKSSLVSNAVFWSHFRFLKSSKNLPSYFSAEDIRIQVRGPPVNYVYCYHEASFTRGDLGYVPYQKGINHGHPGGWINIKMPSYQYMKSHCGDKTILRSSYLHNGISYTGKTTSLYWIEALVTGVQQQWKLSACPPGSVFRLYFHQM